MVQLIIYLLTGLIYSASSTLTVLMKAINSMSLYNFVMAVLKKYDQVGKVKNF